MRSNNKYLIQELQAGVNGLLDVARQSYEEGCQDAYKLVEELKGDIVPILESTILTFYRGPSAGSQDELRQPAAILHASCDGGS